MIGVIGGNGVAATNILCKLIEEQRTSKGAYRDGHHPEMIVWQATQAPSRSMYLEGRGESFVDDYIRIGKHLKNCGCTQLCMCCNTAHFCIDELEEKIGLPFINIITETLCSIDPSHKRVGVICSDGAMKYDLYGEFARRANKSSLEIVYPDSLFQDMVTRGICNSKNLIRNKEDDSEFPQKLFTEVFHHLVDKGCTCIILGCTDINAVFTPPNIDGIQCVDSLKILSNYIEVHY